MKPGLPAADLEQPVLAELLDVLAAHGLTESPRHLGQDVGVVVVGGGLHDGPGPSRGILGLEDAGPHEVPVHAQPLIRIMAAPSARRCRASPRSRAPHTKGTVNCHLSMWCSSSAGVSTSDSSM